MAASSLNLARRPFVNRRPVARLAIALWIIALAVTLADIGLYAHYAAGSRDRRQALSSAQTRLSQDRSAIQQLQKAAEFQGLRQYNAKVDYLNSLITARTFPWGRLFDRLGEVMPAGVRLRRLTPRLGAAPEGDGQAADDKAGAADAATNDSGPLDPASSAIRPVGLHLDGTAQSDQALYAFVDALFQAPDFDNPVLAREAESGSGQTFSMSVTYLTSVGASQTAPAGGESDENEAAQAAGGSR